MTWAKWISVLVLNLSRVSSLTDSELWQNPIHLDGTKLARETFVLRHVFYHDLRDPYRQHAAFTAISQNPGEKAHGTVWTTGHLKAISIDRGVSQIGRESMSVGNHETIVRCTATSPNITDKDTIINLAKMTSDAYVVNSSDTGWLNLTNGFRDSLPFGYDEDGLRGHLFSNLDNSTVVVAFKGSALNPLDRTRTKDRLNDNLLFSCCCGAQRPDPYWYGEVCSCKQDVYKCNATCLTSELVREDRYYTAAISIMHNVTRDLFPSSNVWTTGHSLGGTMASLMGLTFGVPAVTFEAPPDRLSAQRIGLVPRSKASSRSSPPAYHFGNSADPVWMGACNGALSTCAAAGYAFESQCFTGKKCMYDTMGDKGWHSFIGNHRIVTVIDDVLSAYDKVPECVDEDDECTDCFMWNFD